ncbi:MAG: ABC transporter substrate-binding protein [Coriobacteriia bacterium]|nr:ABC transporter substrate-binding protein [Coriobacteriia bacterium]
MDGTFFEGLYEYDHRTGKIVDGLADGDPIKINDLTYDVKIKNNQLFSDGSRITAGDIQEAFGANLTSTTFCSLIDFIKTIEVKDDFTVRFRLEYPFESMMKERLSIIRIYKEPDKIEDTGKKPIGSGPWIYKSAEGKNEGLINLMPNGKYDGEFAPKVKAMEWKVLTKEEERVKAFLGGQVDVMECVPVDSIEKIKASGKKVEAVQSMSLPLIIFNTVKAPFDDIRVRQAILYAINTEHIIEEKLKGYATPATSFLHEAHKSYHRASTVYNYNPEIAKQLLNGQKIDMELMVSENSWCADFADLIEHDLDAVGINCNLNIKSIDWDKLSENDATPPFDVIMTPGDPSCFGDDADLLMSWWYGDNTWTFARSCWQNAKNSRFKELQDLMQKARVSSGDAQQELWNQCYDLIAAEVPMYPLLHRQMITAYDDTKLKDFKPISTTGLWLLDTGVKSQN